MPVADVVHQAAHQANSSSMPGRVDVEIRGLSGGHVETWTGVSNYDHECGSINLDPAANCLAAVILAAVEYRIG